MGGLSFSSLYANEDVSALIQSIEQSSSLNKEKQESLATSLSRKGSKKWAVTDRKKVQLACFKQSQKLMGRQTEGRKKGQLKVVKAPGEKMILKVAGDYLNHLPPEKVPAHSSAGDLFGEIPKGAARVEGRVKINPKVVRWHSTGAYAAPGEVVTLIFPEAWVKKGLKVHVSGHKDNISTKKSLMRLPSSPSRSFSVDSTTVKVAAAFGGAIYIDTGNAQRKEAPFSVKIVNALQAPYFVLGKTDVLAWKNTIRHAPAPYAELVSDRIALSFPSAWIRQKKSYPNIR